jgi:mono/diheme cytochrome c family protein
MIKLLKILGALVGVVVLGVVGFALFIHFRGIPTYEVPQVEFTAVPTPENLARGRKLTETLCASCHRNSTTHTLAGGPMRDAPAVFGKLYTPNITRDPVAGIGEWTDAELLVLLRTGIKRDGSYAPPYMAKLPNMADSDLEAIIAFLKSDDPLVAADPTPNEISQPSFLVKFLSTIAWKPLPMPSERITLPDSTDQLAMGRYLAHNLECFSCHSADFKSNDFMEPEKSLGYFGGGNRTLDLAGNIILTTNLTPDPETGIGSWDEARFIAALKTGQMQGEQALRYPMLPYSALEDWEAAAIFAYLKTVPPLKNKVPRTGLDPEPVAATK